MEEEIDDDGYGYLNVIHDNEKFFVEYLHTKDPLWIDIISTDYMSGHPVEDFVLLQEVNRIAEDAILKRINNMRIY